MWCRICTSHNTNTKWNLIKEYWDKAKKTKDRGISRFRIDSIKNHALSSQHREAIQRKLQSQNLKSGFTNMFTQASQEWRRLLHFVLFMTQENLVYAKYPDFCSFVKQLGVKLTDEQLYNSRYAYLEILQALSEYIWSQQIEKIKQAKYTLGHN